MDFTEFLKEKKPTIHYGKVTCGPDNPMVELKQLITYANEYGKLMYEMGIAKAAPKPTPKPTTTSSFRHITIEGSVDFD